jgi:hypothetical protein
MRTLSKRRSIFSPMNFFDVWGMRDYYVLLALTGLLFLVYLRFGWPK